MSGCAEGPLLPLHRLVVFQGHGVIWAPHLPHVVGLLLVVQHLCEELSGRLVSLLVIVVEGANDLECVTRAQYLVFFELAMSDLRPSPSGCGHQGQGELGVYEVLLEIQGCLIHLLVAGGGGRLLVRALILGPIRMAYSFLLLSLVFVRLEDGPFRSDSGR